LSSGAGAKSVVGSGCIRPSAPNAVASRLASRASTLAKPEVVYRPLVRNERAERLCLAALERDFDVERTRARFLFKDKRNAASLHRSFIVKEGPGIPLRYPARITRTAGNFMKAVQRAKLFYFSLIKKLTSRILYNTGPEKERSGSEKKLHFKRTSR